MKRQMRNKYKHFAAYFIGQLLVSLPHLCVFAAANEAAEAANLLQLQGQQRQGRLRQALQRLAQQQARQQVSNSVCVCACACVCLCVSVCLCACVCERLVACVRVCVNALWLMCMHVVAEACIREGSACVRLRQLVAFDSKKGWTQLKSMCTRVQTALTGTCKIKIHVIMCT
jgi:ABC-type spermidine/putrescine transport system permease subunit II